MSQLMVTSDTSHLGWLGALLTVLFMASFIGWTIYAYAPSNRDRHEAAARLPFEDGDER